jgi:hypothetical protein
MTGSADGERRQEHTENRRQHLHLAQYGHLHRRLRRLEVRAGQLRRRLRELAMYG